MTTITICDICEEKEDTLNCIFCGIDVCHNCSVDLDRCAKAMCYECVKSKSGCNIKFA